MPESQSPTAAGDRPRLTEAQKKENHIRSEQKRREAIREGFDRLASIVPGLEGLGRSEAVVLGGAIKLMREKIVEREALIVQAKLKGIDTTGWELDQKTLEACAEHMDRIMKEEQQASNPESNADSSGNGNGDSNGSASGNGEEIKRE
jgi:heteromeric Ino2p/Ino4p transcription factor